MPAPEREFVVGTRGSSLALAQAAIVCDALRRVHPGIRLRVERITTTGDAWHDVPLFQLGRGVFVTEIEVALREGRIDLAVHSAKDLPSTLAPGFALGAIPARADARDVLVSGHGTLGTLRAGARIGTSSPRRACQLRALRPDIQTVDVRGNVDTRLRKLAQGDFDALVMAAAGLIRLDRAGEVTEWFEPDAFVPSVGQGAIAVEVRTHDEDVLELVRPLNDPATYAAVIAERAFLAELGAGCQAAAGAYARVDPATETLRMIAFIGTQHGDQVRASRSGAAGSAQAIGIEIAHDLLLNGGAPFLAKPNGALSGAVVAITRPADRAAELVTLLRACGAFPIVCPTIAVEAIPSTPELDAILFAEVPPRWIAFTSVSAVESVAVHLLAAGRRLPERSRLGVVGEATATAVEHHFRRPDFVSSGATAETLAAGLPDVAGATVLFLRGDVAASTLKTGLSARGATVREVVVYRTVEGPGVEDLAACARTGRLDAVVFASPSSVRFAKTAIETFLSAANGAPVVICIGPTTARAARESGLDVVEASSTSVGGLVEGLERALTARLQSTVPAPGSGGHD